MVTGNVVRHTDDLTLGPQIPKTTKRCHRIRDGVGGVEGAVRERRGSVKVHPCARHSTAKCNVKERDIHSGLDVHCSLFAHALVNPLTQIIRHALLFGSSVARSNSVCLVVVHEHVEMPYIRSLEPSSFLHVAFVFSSRIMLSRSVW